MENNFEDEFRDFSLLLTNQLLLGIFMTELPILSYQIEVGTNYCKRVRQPLVLIYRWLGGINNEEGDTRRVFQLTTHIRPESGEYKIYFELAYTKSGLESQDSESWLFEFKKVKEFLFMPTDRSGEAIVNEVLIWIRTQMAEIMSGVN